MIAASKMEDGRSQMGGFRECESPRVSGQPTPRDAVDRMGGGRFEGANVKVNGKLKFKFKSSRSCRRPISYLLTPIYYRP